MLQVSSSSRALWRRQIVLTALAVVAFGGVAGLTQLALSDWGRSPRNQMPLLMAAAAVGLAVVLLLGAVCIHALRIARLTFASLDNAPETD